MKLKTYHAYSMAEALAAVKHDLGADAVILHTRTFKRGGLFGFRRKTIVEVTATPAQSSMTKPSKQSGPPNRHVQAQRAYANALTVKVTSAPTTEDVGTWSISPQEDQQRTRMLAMAMEETRQRQQAEAAAADSSFNMTAKSANGAAVPSIAPVPAAAPRQTVARRFILAAPDVAGNQEKFKSLDVASQNHVHQPNPFFPSTVPLHFPLTDELSAIKQLVGQVLQRQMNASGQPNESMPPLLFDHYLKLVAQDISEELSHQIIDQVRNELSGSELEDVRIVRAAVMKHLAGFIPVNGDAFTQVPIDGRPLTIALVGPTGVGKTTTLAKLAATFKLRHGKSVGLITADTYRIAAVDQLRTYADIIDLPLQVALTPAEMKRAVQSYSDRDVILIDTAGRSQRDKGRLAELKRFIQAANPHEVHMVLSSAASEKVLLQEAQAFSQVGVHRIVLTKLDEAVSFGMLVNVVRQIGTQLSFVTTGQEVPDHLEVGSADRLADLVLTGSFESEAALR